MAMEAGTQTTGLSRDKEISRGIVTIYKDYLGRGPTRSQTVISRDLVTTVCEDGLTRAERNLVEEGEDDTVREIRRKFQSAMRTDIISLVGAVMDRPVKTLLSDHDVVNDIAVETVVLEPVADESE
jgi:uncharacterized protein YbcI